MTAPSPTRPARREGSVVLTASPRDDLAPGSHVCWVVDESVPYVEIAAALLAQGHAAGQKPVAFAPQGSGVLAQLEATAADPGVALLGGGPLEPETTFALLREQAKVARADGFDGLRVVADMEWLLPAQSTTVAIIGFELLLDRVVAELNATVICAYRQGSFAAAVIEGVRCVHPLAVAGETEPPFRLVAGEAGGWRLSGEVDFACSSSFAAALRAAAQADCVIDVAELDFIDVAGLREIATVGQSSVRLRNPSPMFQRAWKLARFDECAPSVQLAG